MLLKFFYYCADASFIGKNNNKKKTIVVKIKKKIHEQWTFLQINYSYMYILILLFSQCGNVSGINLLFILFGTNFAIFLVSRLFRTYIHTYIHPYIVYKDILYFPASTLISYCTITVYKSTRDRKIADTI